MARLFFFVMLLTSVVACGAISSSAQWALPKTKAADAPPRLQAIARAQVWTPTNIRAMDIRRGPAGPGAFPFQANVTCDYVPKQLSGGSPKFACMAGEDELKVKYSGTVTGQTAGRTNAEVFAEVLSTRLLWALGFGADAMYPVNVICHRCPSEFGGIERPNHESRFDPAVIERKLPGREWPPDGPRGWSWREFLEIEPDSAGAPRAQRDALTLLAVFIQHTDTKVQQQRIVCLGATSKSEACRRPFLMIQDLGVTFGRANFSNRNFPGSTNLTAWRSTPVWKGETGCTGNLPKSFSGTLDDPVISESGRRFLAGLLTQLSDRQLRDLFEVARVELRLRKPGDADSGFATVDEWVDAFKMKRAEIVNRRCDVSTE